jgi:lambda family phage portal protein
MAILDIFRRKKTANRSSFKRSYASANPGRLFADFKSSERSADSELSPVLKVIRSRSRDLVRNNSYAKRYMSLLKTNVIGGKGFNLQVKALDSVGNLDVSGNSAVEAAFSSWSKAGNPTVDGKLNWVDAQRLALETLARDGEVFIVKHRSADFKDSFAIEFVESDQVDENKNEKLANGNEIRMGVELNKFKKPIAYHFTTYHPGDYDYTAMGSSKQSVRIPADKVLHIYIPLRAGQTRGEPWMSPAMAGLKQLGAYIEAALVSARVGASKMGFFTSSGGDGFIPDDLDNQVPIMDAEPGTFHQLPNGVDFTAFDPQNPNNEFEGFHKSVLKSIASALGISYTSLSNDLEATSYSSIRQGALEERDYYRDTQQFMIDHFARPIYESWLASAMEMNNFGIPVRQYERFSSASEFRAKGWSWIDPLKEMNASVVGLKSGILSLQDVASQYGKDTEELMSQIARDRDLAEQFDVKYALEPYGATQVGIVPDITSDDGENNEE